MNSLNDIPNIANGQNEISFSGDDPEALNARVQVTIIGEGDFVSIIIGRLVRELYGWNHITTEP